MNFAVFIKKNETTGVAVMKPYPENNIPPFAVYKGEVYLRDDVMGVDPDNAVRPYFGRPDSKGEFAWSTDDKFIAFIWEMGANAQPDERLPSGWVV